MNQFRIERNQYGNLRIFLHILGHCETLVCLRQFNQRTGAWE